MKKRVLLIILVLFAVGWFKPAYCGDEVLCSRLRGAQIAHNATIDVGAYLGDHSGWDMQSADISVRLCLAEDRLIARPHDIDYMVKYQLVLVSITDSSYTVVDSVMVYYRTAGEYVDMYLNKYSDYKYANLRVLSVNASPVPEDLFLEVQLHFERTSIRDTLAAVSNVNGTYQQNTNELQLSWSYLPGADSYDVEWLFVDNPKGRENIPYNFANATNINVTSNHYDIPLAYPKGTILYRVRGVGTYYSVSDSVRYPLYGKWSYASQSGSVLPASLHPEYRYDFAGLEDSLTWQYTAVYAEDGKRKEVITFFDGTLRNRQEVTVMSTSPTAIVGETFYDYMGRQALSAMPSPTTSRGVRYYGTGASSDGLFNGTFGKNEYDADSTLTHGKPFPPTSGSAIYRSSNNPFLNNPHWINAGCIAADTGYTYTRTRYLNDGTNRVHSQSNVGNGYQLGGGRETKYFYGNPMQVELDRIFGNEAGNASHYQKVLAVDPNGETTVSYYDMKERLIASAIIPSANDSILLPIDFTPESIDLSESLVFDEKNRTYTQNIVVGAPSQYSFSYHFTPATKLCDTCGERTGCIDCRYKIVMSLWNPDAQRYEFRDSLITSSERNLTHTLQLTPGSYQLYKSVTTVNDDKTDEAFTKYAIRQRDCVEYERADTASCYTPCEEYAMGMAQLLKPDSMNDEYLSYLRQCENPPQNPNTECEAKLQAMLNDMSPGGQYFDNIRTCCPGDTTCFLESGINAYLLSICADRLWEDPDIIALKDDLEASDFNLDFWEMLRAHWQPQYAEIMLKYHPEYFLYKAFCDCCDTDLQNEFDSIFFNTNSFQEANELGLLNPLGFDIDEDMEIQPSPDNGYQPFMPVMTDPFFNEDYGCCPEMHEDIIAFMHEKLFSYLSWDDHYASIWWMLFDPACIATGGYVHDCEAITGIMDTLQNIIVNEWANNYQCSTDDARWMLFKSIYLYLKQECRALFMPVCMETCNRTSSDLCGDDQNPPGECCNCPRFQWGQQEWWLDRFDISALGHCEYYLMADKECPSVPLTVGDIHNGQGGFQIRFLCNPIFGLDAGNIIQTAEQNLDLAYGRCCEDCEAHANSWMAELRDYLLTHCPEIDDIRMENIRASLVALCVQSCENSRIMRDFTNVQRIDPDILAQILDDGCESDPYNYPRIVYPRPEGFLSDCGCNNYQLELNTHGLTFWSDAANIRKILEQEGIEASESDISQWNSFCIWERYDNLLNRDDNTNPLYENNFPEKFRCLKEAGWLEDCHRQAILAAAAQDTFSFHQALDNMVAVHRALYEPYCMGDIFETLDITCSSQEFLYTLYYYDQADNLVRTVPPKGACPISNPITLDEVSSYRNNIARYDTLYSGFIRPGHNMSTNYRYNTLNQVTQSYQPDHDSIAVIHYDILSRPVLSQNEQQRRENKHSYTIYDSLGRIIEVGQVRNNTAVTDRDAKDAAFVRQFISSGVRTEITRTFYDKPLVASLDQTHLRNRISAVTYSDTLAPDTVYQTATHYSYDIHGNVRQVIQNIPALAPFARDFVKIDYSYDLVSGNVNSVWYQKGKPEQIGHRYRYDADNRLTHTYTSVTTNMKLYPTPAEPTFLTEERLEARYFYYPDGALSRVETGHKRIEGTDYAYTLQGWLKDLNGHRTDTASAGANDIGSDALTTLTATPNRQFTPDASALMLQYNAADYHPVTGMDFYNLPATSANPLYNGNISALSSNTCQTEAMLKTFRYDKLNRIKQMQTATLNGTNWGNPAYNFATLYSYDFNGNITSLYRNNAFQQTLHNIAYQYNVLENRLRSITATGLNSSSYQYDAVGNLTHDSGERLRVAWNAAGKVDRIWRNDSLLTMFRYNPTGQRQVKQRGDTTDYYLHDAAGNVMCIYTHKGDTLTAIERPFYGSKRLGESEQRFLLGPGGTLLSYDTATIGLRRYELTDHLGNVMAVYSDRKIGVDTDSDGYVNYYAPEIISVNDYYPFGYPMRERSFSAGDYRYGFNGQEADGEVFGEGVLHAFEYRMHDTRIGRFWSVDPLAGKFPWNSTYAFAENRVVDGRELEGLEALLFVENEGVGHVFVGVFTKNDIRIYTYGRYMGSFFPSSGQFGPIGDAVLIKYDGAKAQEYIREHFNKGNSAKAYLIPSAKPDKIIAYYETLLNNGDPLPKYVEKDGKTQANPYYGYGKYVGTYSLVGRSCVTISTNSLKEGDFDITREAFPQIPPVGIIAPSNVQLMIDAIMAKDASTDGNPRIYDCTKDIKENAEKSK